MKVDKINLDLGNVWLFSSTSSSQKEKKNRKTEGLRRTKPFLNSHKADAVIGDIKCDKEAFLWTR